MRPTKNTFNYAPTISTSRTKSSFVICCKVLDFNIDFIFETRVPVNVRAVVYCTAIAEGNQTVWDLFWNRFRTANVASEQVLILKALGCTRNNVTLIGYLNRIVGADVRLQDKNTAFAAAYNEQPENVQTVLDYITANHEKIVEIFESEDMVATLLSNVAMRYYCHFICL